MTMPVDSSRPLVMGILNVTPDSFSDGGLWEDRDAAVAHGLAMVEAGADLVDVGGESTRPGAVRTTPEQELGRVLPVVAALVAAGVGVSVDTMRAEVAEQTLAAGATVVNDVSGGLADPRMLKVVAGSAATYVAMHWRAHGADMQRFTSYPGGVLPDVVAELRERLAAIEAAGVDLDRVVLDPGLGFAKTPGQNWEVLRDLGPLLGLGRPVLLGASRKSFLGSLLPAADGSPRSVSDREHAHAALVAWVSGRWPVWGWRVHDVRATRDALAAVTALAGGPR